jgi:deazaflavin-dependent oxidoreductase (nitroreductase family)
MTALPNNALRCLFRLPVYLYRGRLGRLLGHRFLLLTHVGRRTGFRHQTVLEVMGYRKDGPEAIVMSGFGPNADWLLNLEANGEAKVEIGSVRFPASFRILEESEAAEVVKGYEHRNRWAAPVIRMVLTRLIGWRYRGSEIDRRRLVAQLPLVAFRPRG